MADEYPKCIKCGTGILMPIKDYDGVLLYRCTLCGWSTRELLLNGK
ncbi:MAG: hypothetical protein A4E32_02147 [Methanomassiliicoccales archaeon PtaU1.Bin124]|nr:MAG: hypothetical protein A4E32_02147 [Methanomassiliicoccales archaeon PtaU1.Bin124]